MNFRELIKKDGWGGFDKEDIRSGIESMILNGYALAAMHEGLDERLIADNEKHRIYMRAVRDEDGNVLGYYERYEPPAK